MPQPLPPAQFISPISAAEKERTRAQLFVLARQSMTAFVAAVMTDEATGLPLRQANVHKAWHGLADQHDRLLIWSAIEHGKTTQLAVARTLWELGRDPTLRIGIVSNTYGQAEKIVRSVARYIEQSEALRRVFPELKKGEQWSAGRITVRRPYVSKDPSVQALGVHGALLGARLDRLIVDDVLDYENTRTPKLRQDLWDWYHATLEGRLTARGRTLVIGTAFHPDDLLHRLARVPGWHAVRYPVVDETGAPRWPERWPLSRIEEKRARLGPMEFARQLLCVARADSEARFKREWLDRCLVRGNGKSVAYGLSVLPPGVKTYTGVDLAVQQHSAADFTVLFTIAVHPNGDREVLNCEAGKWAGPEIVNRIIDHHRRYMSLVVVENNAAQDFIVQFARGSYAIPIRPFTTGRNKAHPEFGVESIAAEMAGGKWVIPNNEGRCTPDIDAWLTEMLYYDPTAHTGDRLMASWFAREGARMGALSVQQGTFNTISR